MTDKLTESDDDLTEQVLNFNNLIKNKDEQSLAILHEAREYIIFAQSIGWQMSMKDALLSIFLERKLKKELNDNWPQVLKKLQDDAQALREAERKTKGKTKAKEKTKRKSKAKVDFNFAKKREQKIK